MFYPASKVGQGWSALTTLLPLLLTELQGLVLSGPLVGVAANTAIAVSEGIKPADTLIKALAFVNGTGFVDITPTTVINPQSATGEITLSNVKAGDQVEVNGTLLTFQSVEVTTSTNLAPGIVAIGASDVASAANLVQAINAQAESITASLDASGNPIVDLIAMIPSGEDQTAGNSFGLSVGTLAANTDIVLSGATLTGGTNTGTVSCSQNTTGAQIFLLFFHHDYPVITPSGSPLTGSEVESPNTPIISGTNT